MSKAKFIEFPYPDIVATAERIAGQLPPGQLAEHRERIVESLKSDIAKTREMISEALEVLPAEMGHVYGKLFEAQLTTAEGIIARLTGVADKAVQLRLAAERGDFTTAMH